MYSTQNKKRSFPAVPAKTEASPYKMRSKLRKRFANLCREERMFVVLCHLSKRSVQPGFPAEALPLLQCLQLEWRQRQRDQLFDIQPSLTLAELGCMHDALTRMSLLTVVNLFPHSSPEHVHQLILQVRWNKACGDRNDNSPILACRISL